MIETIGPPTLCFSLAYNVFEFLEVVQRESLFACLALTLFLDSPFLSIALQNHSFKQ